MAYADSSDLASRFDARIIGDLASDTGERVPVDQLDNSSVVSDALEDATGRVNSALSVGKQYDTDDLLALTGGDLSLLKRIVCQLAMIYLMERRQENFGNEQLKGIKESVEEYLEMLRNGERIFAIDANLAASLPGLEGPTTLDYNVMNLMSTTRVHHFYPNVDQRLPQGRSFRK